MATTVPVDQTPAPPATGGTLSTRPVHALWLVLLGTPIAYGMTAPTLILPEIAGGAGTSVRSAAWLVTAFGWGIAAGTPLIAGLISRRGVRAALLASAGTLLAGTLLLCLAPVLPALVVARAAQGIGAAGLTAIAMSLAGSPRRMGMVTAGIAGLGAVGPLAGSELAAVWPWQAALALLAVSVAAVPAVARGARDVTAEDSPFDFLGAALLTGFVTASVFVISAPLPAGACLVLVAVLLALRIRRRPDGFVPAALLRSGTFTLLSGLGFLLATGHFTLFYLMPGLLSDAAGWGDGRVGTGILIAQLAGSAGSLVLASAAGRLARRTVLGALVALGLAAPALALAGAGPVVLLAASGVAVLAASAAQATLSILSTETLPDRRRPAGIGLFNVCYQLGGALGPALAAQFM
ncbi:Major facilitator superfamily protein OS=Streptomyces glaucescens OX=1907 GN=SGLAU_17365 PE=4 SV=1 [Streptomyces glaucescens]